MSVLSKVLILSVAVGTAVGVGGFMGGCSRGGGGASRTVQTSQRPLIQESAVEAAKRQDGSELAFYDALETLPMASQDDAVNASLLLGTGSTAPTFDQRIAAAKTLKYIPNEYSRPARQAVTVGEVSSMFVGILEGKLHDPEDALMRMQRRNAVTANVQAYHGLTGAQLASIIGATRDAMGIEGVQRVALPSPPPPPARVIAVAPEPPPAPAPAPVTTKPPTEANDADKLITSGAALSDPTPAPVSAPPSSPPPAPAPVAATPAPAAPAPTAPSDAAGTVGRPEPLPNIPTGTPAKPAIEVQEPKTKPVVIGPSGKPTAQPEPSKPVAARPEPAPAAPAPAPVKPPEPKAETPKKEETKPAPPSPWVTGRPLKKGTDSGK